METLTFKTNINCDACVSKVKPVLDKNQEVAEWKVDLNNPEKILTVETNGLDEEDLIHALKKVGYSAERIEK